MKKTNDREDLIIKVVLDHIAIVGASNENADIEVMDTTILKQKLKGIIDE